MRVGLLLGRLEVSLGSGLAEQVEPGNEGDVHNCLDDLRASLRLPYAVRRVPEDQFARVLPCPVTVKTGDIVLAEVESIGKNTTLELTHGRRCALHPGDHIVAVFGNRYATLQFEGYARAKGDGCHLLSMGGMCGLVASKHASVAEPTKLRILGSIGNAAGTPLNLRQFAGVAATPIQRPRVLGVCGTSMDAGKTHTVMSLIIGLREAGFRVAGIKLTGSATGRDTWTMLDAGACGAFDFVDGGLCSTYLCTLAELLSLYDLLIAQAAEQGAEWVVMEIADGVLQRETSALLQCPEFTRTVSCWVFAAGDPLAAAGGVSVLRNRGLEPMAISGLVSMSPLGMQEATKATGLHCVTAADLQAASVIEILSETAGRDSGVARCAAATT